MRRQLVSLGPDSLALACRSFCAGLEDGADEQRLRAVFSGVGYRVAAAFGERSWVRFVVRQ